MEGFRSLREGESVQFVTEIAPDGRQKAIKVTGPGGAAPQASLRPSCDLALHQQIQDAAPGISPRAFCYLVCSFACTCCPSGHYNSATVRIDTLRSKLQAPWQQVLLWGWPWFGDCGVLSKRRHSCIIVVRLKVTCKAPLIPKGLAATCCWSPQRALAMFSTCAQLHIFETCSLTNLRLPLRQTVGRC